MRPPHRAGLACDRHRRPLAAAGASPDREPEPAAAEQPAASRRSALALLAGAAALSLGQQAAVPLPAQAAAKAQRDSGDWSSPGLGTPVDPSQPK